MATLADVDEFGELLLVLVVIAAVAYLGKKVTDLGASAKDLLGFNATIGPNSFQGKPLTAQQARSIAVLVTGSPTNYTLSPDATQVWFFDGSYYDNTSGHVFDAQGNDQGTLDAVQTARGGQVTNNAETSNAGFLDSAAQF